MMKRKCLMKAETKLSFKIGRLVSVLGLPLYGKSSNQRSLALQCLFAELSLGIDKAYIFQTGK